MCSIFGTLGCPKSEGESLIKAMAASQVHRGPDGHGAFSDNDVNFGMNRLAIVGLADGWQPLYSESKDIVLVCNGEIYNELELRKRLESLGHRYATHSDCETIIHGYEAWGIDVLKELRGMYAFCLYDKRAKKVILARDRIGEKPLYFIETKGTVYFASEAKALVAAGVCALDIDLESFYQYFLFNYIPEPDTLFLGLRKLPAGHYLEYDCSTKKSWVHQYWSLDNDNQTKYSSLNEALDDVGNIILRSERPIGVALSGGLDSSLIAALTRKYHSGDLYAFSIGYPGRPECDERDDAKKLADHLGMKFVDVEVSADSFVSDFDKVIFANDDPICDISSVNYYTISKTAKRTGVPVLLQGQGGDELFWGYQWVRESVVANYHKERQLGNLMKKEKIPFRKNLVVYFQQQLYRERVISHRKMSLGINDKVPFFYNLTPDFQYTLGYAKKLFKVGSEKSILLKANIWGNDSENLESCITKSIIRTYLLENGIAQGDRLSMNNSVELRLPLVDHRLIEFVLSQRKSGAFIGDYQLEPKHHLKKAAASYLPEWVLKRKKRGFTPPVTQWISSLVQKREEKLKSGFLAKSGLLNIDRVTRSFHKGEDYSTFPFMLKALILESYLESMRGILK